MKPVRALVGGQRRGQDNRQRPDCSSLPRAPLVPCLRTALWGCVRATTLKSPGSGTSADYADWQKSPTKMWCKIYRNHCDLEKVITQRIGSEGAGVTAAAVGGGRAGPGLCMQGQCCLRAAGTPPKSRHPLRLPQSSVPTVTGGRSGGAWAHLTSERDAGRGCVPGSHCLSLPPTLGAMVWISP